MSIEHKPERLTVDEDLMTEEELRAWEEKYESTVDFGVDPLELLGKNRSKNKRVVMTGTGPDDGDML